MPKVSDEHRAARREQILLAAMGCVAREGFHRTTMADVIEASGLSAGAVYGYFKSKDDLIVALADRAVGLVEPLFAELLAREPLPSLPEAVAALTGRVGSLGGSQVDITKVAVAAWAEAVRNPVVHDRVSSRFVRIRAHFVELAGRLQEEGRIDPAVDPTDVGKATFGAMPGFVLQRLIVGDVDPEGYAAGLRALGGDVTPSAAPARASAPPAAP